MGKRRRQRSVDRIKSKIKKLERKLQRHNESTDSDSYVSEKFEDDPIDSEFEYLAPSVASKVVVNSITMDPPGIVPQNPTATITAVETHPVNTLNPPEISTEDNGTIIDNNGTCVPETGTQNDQAILELLGEDPETDRKYGPAIQADLAIRIQHFVTQGLPKETQKDLQNTYLLPSNCTLIDAPLLNPEIKAAITEVVNRRDINIAAKQKKIASAISCLGTVVSTLLGEEDKNTNIIKLLMDSIRLICDCQHSDTVVRRNMLLRNLKKDMVDHIRNSKIDKFLFGVELPEVLKSAKSLTKSASDLKNSPVPRTTNTNTKPHQGLQTRNNLNWKAPPAKRRQLGNQRSREPAERGRPKSSSRPSQQRPTSSRGRPR